MTQVERDKQRGDTFQIAGIVQPSGVDGSRSGELDVRTMLPQLTREHIKAGMLLRDMRLLTHHYTPPDGACPSFRALFSGLEGIERELHRHVHLENNVLFPRAAALESELELQRS